MRSSITALFHKRPPAARVYIIAALLMGGLVGVLLAQPAPVLASDPPTQPFDLVFEASGQKLQVYNGGLGMLGQTEGTLTDVNLGGTEIVAAYLVWAGLGRDDDGITLQRVGGGPAQTLTPTAELTWNNDRYGKPTWGCCGRELSVYAADLLASGIVQLGVHDYTVADMDIQHVSGGQQVSENWGFSLIVAYVDPTLPAPRNVVIKLGNDGLFANWGEIESPSGNILGPNSDVQCFAFDAAGYEREAQFSVVVSGVASGDRHNAIWSGTGSEAYVDPATQGGTWTQDQGLVHLPPNIVGIDIDGGKATQVAGPEEVDGVWTSPFADRSGDEWDEFPIIDVVGIDRAV